MQMRRKTWVRRACFALAFLACFAVPGCAPAPNAAPAGSRDAPAGEKTVFTICVDSEADKTFYKTLHGGLANQFPQVTFEFVRAWNAGGPGAQAAANYEAAMTKLRTEIMSGRGPDLFLLSDEYGSGVFPDPEKQMRAGVFADLTPYLDTIGAGASLNEAVLAAGRVDGAQYLLPLYYTVPGVVAPADLLAGFDAGENPAPAAFLEKLLAHCGAEGFAPVAMLTTYADQFTWAPSLNYGTSAARLDEDQTALLSLLIRAGEWAQRMGYQARHPIPEMPSREAPFAAFPLGAGVQEQQAFDLLCQEREPAVLPIPNGREGVTASVALYAGVRANSPHARLAAEILALLLRPEALKRQDGTFNPWFYSLDQNEVQGLFERSFERNRSVREKNGEAVPFTKEDCTALARQFADAAKTVNAARFTGFANGALYREVIVPVTAGETTLEEAARDFEEAYDFYFEE